MSKAIAILVTDMPRNCRNCRFAYEPWLKDEMICDIAHKNFNKTDSDKR